MNIVAKIGVSIGLAIASLFGFHQSVPQAPVAPLVGSTVPVATSFYSDSLQSGITPTQTSFTLVRGTDGQGKSIAGTYGFVIDQGSASQEIVYCTNVSGVNVSSCIRGVDLTYGTTSVASLEQTHNRGASVQITTAPVVNIMANILRGVDSIAQPIYYDPSVSTAAVGAQNNNIASVAYVNTTAALGCGNSSESVNGCAQLATGAQAAAGTSLGSTGGRLVLPSSLATSTCQFAQNSVLIASSTTGKLDGNCLNTAYNYIFTGNQTFASTTVATSTVYQETVGTLNATSSIIAKNITFTGTLSGNVSASHYSYYLPAGTTFDTNCTLHLCQATSTFIVVPANVMNASSTISIDIGFRTIINSGSGSASYTLVNAATGALVLTFLSGSSASTAGIEHVNIMNANSASSQVISDSSSFSPGGTVVGSSINTSAGFTLDLVTTIAIPSAANIDGIYQSASAILNP